MILKELIKDKVFELYTAIQQYNYPICLELDFLTLLELGIDIDYFYNAYFIKARVKEIYITNDYLEDPYNSIEDTYFYIKYITPLLNESSPAYICKEDVIQFRNMFESGYTRDSIMPHFWTESSLEPLLIATGRFNELNMLKYE